MSERELRAKLKLETGRVSWLELQRHFARGVVVIVAPGADLVEVAAGIAEDDRQAVQGWLETGQLVRAEDRHARRWAEDDTAFWAVVVAPWVLVQEEGEP